jgi:uncharacterized protein (TIGR02145 family)
MKMKNTNLLTITILTLIFSLGMNKSFSQVTDYDNNVYKTVTIGTQEWMSENLNVEHYRNGDIIPQVQDSVEWTKLTTGAWCYYDNNSENEKIYGKLYNWYAVNDKRGLSPTGWHIPIGKEWFILECYGSDTLFIVSSNKIRFRYAKNYFEKSEIGPDPGSYIENAGDKFKSIDKWKSHDNIKATDEFGFSVIPSGVRWENGEFWGTEIFCAFWSYNKPNPFSASYRLFFFNKSGIYYYTDNEKAGYSVRCIKD